MRKLIVLASGCCMSVAAFGDDLLQCLDPDLVQAIFVHEGTNQRTSFATAVTTDIPLDLADIELPSEFEWIGSIQGEMRDVIAYKTSAPAAASRTAVLDAFAVAGWKSSAVAMPRLSRFVLPSELAFPANEIVCRDTETAGFAVRDAGHARYVNITYERDPERLLCERAPPALCSGAPSFLNLPAGTHSPYGRHFVTATCSRVGVDSSLSAAALAKHLAEQMAAQGWTLDVDWSGEYAAGSTWTRPEDSAIVTIDVISLGGNSYQVFSRLLPP